MVRSRNMLFLQSVAVVIGIFLLRESEAEEECLTGATYWCYDCDSWSDPRCKDPFNWTAPLSELPALKQCDGCCVKIVTNYNKPNEAVRRTCTKNLVINLFMVDHVCMYEGHKTGHMCFCEGDHCNAGPTLRPTLALVTTILVMSVTLVVTQMMF